MTTWRSSLIVTWQKSVAKNPKAKADVHLIKSGKQESPVR